MTDLEAIRARVDAATPHSAPCGCLVCLSQQDVPALLDMVADLTAERDEARRLMVVDFDRARVAEDEVERLTTVVERLWERESLAMRQRDTAEAALDAVRALHQPYNRSKTAALDIVCRVDGRRHPCATIAAIDGALTAGETP